MKIKFMSIFILFIAIFLLPADADGGQSENAPSWADYSEEGTNLWQIRQKRSEPITATSTLLLLFLWYGLAGPFLQAQHTRKLNIKSWFEKGGCIHRTYKNKFRSFCMPTKEEIFYREFIQQVYMIIYSDVSEQTAQLLRYEHQQMLGIYEPPKMDNLSERESLFLLLLKYRLLPYDSGEGDDNLTISKWLLKEEDKNAIKLYRRFSQVWRERPDRAKCDHLKKAWMGKRAGKYIPEETFFELLKCECIRLQSAWGNSDEPIDTETIENCVTLLTSRTELPEMKDEEINEMNNSIRKGMEKVNEAEIGDGEVQENIEEIFHDSLTYFTDENEEEKGEIKMLTKEMTGEKTKETIEKMNEKRETRERMRKDKMRHIWYDFIINFDRKQQLGFLTRLEKNLLVLLTSKIDEIRPKSMSSASTTTTITSSSSSDGTSSGNFLVRNIGSTEAVREGDDKETTYQCRAEFGDYAEECLVAWREQAGDGQATIKSILSLNREQFGIADRDYYYPQLWIDLLESAFKEANEKFEDFLKRQTKSSWPIGRMFVLIEMRRAVCQVYEYANEVEKKWRRNRAITFFGPMKKWMRLFGIRKDEANEAKTESNEAEEKIEKNLSREVFKEFRNLCAKFYERNLHERAQLLPIDGLRGLMDKNDQINGGDMEKVVVGNQSNKKANGRAKNGEEHDLEDIIESENVDNKIPLVLNAEKPLESTKKSNLTKRPDDLLLDKKVEEKEKKSKANKLTDRLFGCFKGNKSKKSRPKRNIYNKIFGTNFQNNHGDNISGLEGAVPVRKKRAAIATTMIAFSLTLIFPQIYLRIHHKYDPVKWLWMCMKYPKSWCQVPMPIQKELAFIRRANKIVVEEMSLETVAKIRKLFERHYYTSQEHGSLIEPSKYLAINGVNLLTRAGILLNCFTYNWRKYSKGKPANVDFILAKLIQIHSKSCIQFVDFMDKARIPNKLIHISTHCSQPGGNL